MSFLSRCADISHGDSHDISSKKEAESTGNETPSKWSEASRVFIVFGTVFAVKISKRVTRISPATLLGRALESL